MNEYTSNEMFLTRKNWSAQNNLFQFLLIHCKSNKDWPGFEHGLLWWEGGDLMPEPLHSYRVLFSFWKWLWTLHLGFESGNSVGHEHLYL